MISIMNPSAFLFLILIPVFFLLRKVSFFSHPSFPLILSDWNGTSFKWRSTFISILRVFTCFLFVVGYLIVVIAFSNPVIHHEEKVYTSRGTDILFVLDISPSMAAKDIDGGTRIDSAKRMIEFLVSQNQGVSFGLVGMSTEAVLSVPPTTDHRTFLERLNGLSVGILGEGSAIGTGLSMAVYHLSTSDAPKKCIILITDGENNAGSIHPETAAEIALTQGITLYSIGIGTRGTVPLEYTDPVTGKVSSGYFESSFDPAPLQKIAYVTGGRYFGIETVNELSLALATINNREKVVQTYQLKNVDENFYDELIFVAAIVFAVAWILSRFVLKEF